jgi:argininosuccinate synthase
MKVVLAYSGGLDTSVMIPWIKERYGCEVVAFVADVGQGGDMAKVGAKAIRTGASKCVVRDLQAEFLKAYAFPALRAGAVYEGKYLLGTAIARPCIAKAQVEVALAEHADAVAHGATGKGNDQVRFEMAYMTLAPSLKVIAPWREWDLKSRTDEFAYAEARGIPVPVTRNSALRVVTPPARCPARGATVRIGFVRGVPASVNGRKTGPVSLVQALNRLGAAHGIGVVDCVENRLVGMKSRGVYETPGGTLLHAALSELVAVCLDRETVRVRQTLSLKYAEMVYCGQWFTPLRGALDAFMAEAARPLTGEVTLGLGRGLVKVLKRASPFARYRASLATFEEGEAYDQRHAEGFIRLFGLPFRGGAGR